MSPGNEKTDQPSSRSAVLRSNTEASDATLVERVLDGDRRAFAILVERYQTVLFNLAFRMVGDYDEAMDVTQSAFVKVYRNLHRFDSRYRFFSWIYRITMNESLNARNARRSTEDVPESIVAPDPNALEEITRQERLHELNRAIANLPDAYRQVIELRHRSELSYREIADVLEIPEKTVKSRLFSARRLLADALSPRAAGKMSGGHSG